MKSLSISRLGSGYIIISLIAGALLVWLLATMLNDVRVIGNAWGSFEATRSEKARTLNSIRREMGYGGMIHEFKNVVLRGGRERLLIVERRIGVIHAAVSRYRTFDISFAEKEALTGIEGVLHKYQSHLRVVQTMISDGKTVINIDRAVTIDDSPATEGLELLNSVVRETAITKGRSNKPTLLYELHAAMGYGGMIHHFKNFVLRGDGELIGKVQSNLTNIKSIISKYDALAKSADEKQALRAVADVIRNYEEKLALSAKMVEDGAKPRTIDIAVRVDDTFALEALSSLTRVLVRDGQETAILLASAISNIKTLIQNMFWIVSVIAGVMLAFSMWLLRYRIVLPLGRLTTSMRALADGRLDTHIPVAGVHTEIGDMAAAMKVFRTSEINRRKAQNEIKERERWFRSLLESAPDATIIVDDEGTILLINKQAEVMFGYSADELVGEKIEILIPDTMHSKHATYRANYTNIPRSRPMARQKDLFALCKSGKVLPVEISLSPIKTSKGLQVAAAVRDITDQKITKQLLEDALMKEKEYSALQRQFVSLASHEFRTPLTIIDGAAQRLVRTKRKLTSEFVQEKTDKIRTAVKRMTELIETTLYAERVEDGNIEMHIEAINLGDFLREICATHSEISPSHDITADVDGLPKSFTADAKLLNIVFSNLLSNAVKYAPDAALIEVTGETKGNMALVRIKDEGLGIAKDDLPHMFERFFRAKTATGIKGTGIGLNLSKHFVEMHGGTIGVDSVEGEGSTFTVRLPIRRQDT